MGVEVEADDNKTIWDLGVPGGKERESGGVQMLPQKGVQGGQLKCSKTEGLAGAVC